MKGLNTFSGLSIRQRLALDRDLIERLGIEQELLVLLVERRETEKDRARLVELVRAAAEAGCLTGIRGQKSDNIEARNGHLRDAARYLLGYYDDFAEPLAPHLRKITPFGVEMVRRWAIFSDSAQWVNNKDKALTWEQLEQEGFSALNRCFYLALSCVPEVLTDRMLREIVKPVFDQLVFMNQGGKKI